MPRKANGRSVSEPPIPATFPPMNKAEEVALKPEAIILPPLTLGTAEIQIVGDSPMIQHRWSDKAMKQIEQKQQKKATGPKEARNPQQEYEDSMYKLPEGGYGFPAVAFKAAAVNACSHLAQITKVSARGSFHIVGDMIKLESKPPYMRTDMVRLGGIGSPADIRYRGQFDDWSVKLLIRYNVNALSIEQIMNLFQHAGFSVGVGEWRPEKDGSYGMFHVGGAKQLKIDSELNKLPLR